jgi:hypothetical protein
MRAPMTPNYFANQFTHAYAAPPRVRAFIDIC